MPTGVEDFQEHLLEGTNTLRLEPQPELTSTVNGAYTRGQALRKSFTDNLDKLMQSQYNYSPDPLDGVDPMTKRQVSSDRLKKLTTEIQNNAKGTYYNDLQKYADVHERDRAIANPGSNAFISFQGRRLNLNDLYNTTRTGKMIPRVETYVPGINNEDYLGRQQGNWQKAMRGVGKLAAKTGINVLGDMGGMAYGIGKAFKEGSFNALHTNEFSDWMDELNQLTDFHFAHYYTEEEKNRGALGRIFSGNGIWDGIVGNGMSYVFGTMVSTALTGWIPVVGWAMNSARWARGAMRLASWISKGGRAAANVKTSLSTLKLAAKAGNTVGGIARTVGNGIIGAGYEATVEAQTFLKDSEQRFSDYVQATTGRKPTQAELDAFREDNISAANTIFLANIGTVGLGNFMLLGKYAGLGSTMLGRAVSGMFGKAGTVLNRKLFGLGARMTREGAMEAVKGNTLQTILRTGYFVTRKPISEGLFEEGFQGAYQNAAQQYVDSRYNKAASEEQVDFWDAVKEGFKEEYTTTEGWVDVGMGAVIGSIFNVKTGFGLLEGRQRANQYKTLVDAYNNDLSNRKDNIRSVAEAALTMNQMNVALTNENKKPNYSFGGGKSVFYRLKLSDQLGMLDEHVKEINDEIDSMDIDALAKEMGMENVDAKAFKESMKQDFQRKVDLYKEAWSTAESILEGSSAYSYAGYVAETIFDGMDAQYNIERISEGLSRLLEGDNGFAQAYAVAADLTTETEQLARNLKELEGQIETLVQEATDTAFGQPTGTTEEAKAAREAKAREIQEKTVRLESLRQEYAEKSALLARGFNSTNSGGLRAAAKALARSDSGGSRTVDTVTVEQILQAYDAVRGLDLYLEGLRKKNGELTATERGVASLSRLYKENIVGMKNAVNLVDNMGNLRFSSATYRRFKAAEQKGLDGFMKINTRDRTKARSMQDVDSKIDEQLRNGKITEEEANAMKFFNHLRDDISPVDPLEGEVRDDIDEDTFGRLRDSWDPNDPVVTGDTGIVAKIANGNNSDILLGEREKELYSLHKDEIDRRVSERGASMTQRLGRLRRPKDALTETKKDSTLYGTARDIVLEGATEEERKELEGLENALQNALRGADFNDLEGNPDVVKARNELNDFAINMGVSFDINRGLGDLFIENEQNRSNRRRASARAGSQGNTANSSPANGGPQGPVVSPVQGPSSPVPPPQPDQSGGAEATQNTNGDEYVEVTTSDGTQADAGEPGIDVGTTEGGTEQPGAARPSSGWLFTDEEMGTVTPEEGQAGSEQPAPEATVVTRKEKTPANTVEPELQFTDDIVEDEGGTEEGGTSTEGESGGTNRGTVVAENPSSPTVTVRENPDGTRTYVIRGDIDGLLRKLFPEEEGGFDNSNERIVLVVERFFQGRDSFRKDEEGNLLLSEEEMDQLGLSKTNGPVTQVDGTRVETPVELGEDGTRTIDEDAAKKAKEGDEVTLVVDMEDPVNKDLAENHPEQFSDKARVEIRDKENKTIGILPEGKDKAPVRGELEGRSGDKGTIQIGNGTRVEGTVPGPAAVSSGVGFSEDDRSHIVRVGYLDGANLTFVEFGRNGTKYIRGGRDRDGKGVSSNYAGTAMVNMRKFYHGSGRRDGMRPGFENAKIPYVVVDADGIEVIYPLTAANAPLVEEMEGWRIEQPNADAINGVLDRVQDPYIFGSFDGAKVVLSYSTSEPVQKTGENNKPIPNPKGKVVSKRAQNASRRNSSRNTQSEEPEGVLIAEEDKGSVVPFDKGLDGDARVVAPKKSTALAAAIGSYRVVSMADWVCRLIGLKHAGLWMGMGNDRNRADKKGQWGWGRAFFTSNVEDGGFGSAYRPADYYTEKIGGDKDTPALSIDDLLELVNKSQAKAVRDWRKTNLNGRSVDEQKRILGRFVVSLLNTVGAAPGMVNKGGSRGRYEVSHYFNGPRLWMYSVGEILRSRAAQKRSEDIPALVHANQMAKNLFNNASSEKVTNAGAVAYAEGKLAEYQARAAEVMPDRIEDIMRAEQAVLKIAGIFGQDNASGEAVKAFEAYYETLKTDHRVFDLLGSSFTDVVGAMAQRMFEIKQFTRDDLDKISNIITDGRRLYRDVEERVRDKIAAGNNAGRNDAGTREGRTGQPEGNGVAREDNGNRDDGPNPLGIDEASDAVTAGESQRSKDVLGENPDMTNRLDNEIDDKTCR